MSRPPFSGSTAVRIFKMAFTYAYHGLRVLRSTFHLRIPDVITAPQSLVGRSLCSHRERTGGAGGGRQGAAGNSCTQSFLTRRKERLHTELSHQEGELRPPWGLPDLTLVNLCSFHAPPQTPGVLTEGHVVQSGKGPIDLSAWDRETGRRFISRPKYLPSSFAPNHPWW